MESYTGRLANWECLKMNLCYDLKCYGMRRPLWPVLCLGILLFSCKENGSSTVSKMVAPTQEEAITNIVEERLIAKGHLFEKKYRDFKKVLHWEKTGERTYAAKVLFGDSTVDLNVRIHRLVVFDAYPDRTFAKYIYKWFEGWRKLANSTAENVEKGYLKAVAKLIVKVEMGSRTTTYTFSCVLFKQPQEDRHFWHIVMDRISGDHAVVKAFEKAYSEETAKEFRQFID